MAGVGYKGVKRTENQRGERGAPGEAEGEGAVSGHKEAAAASPTSPPPPAALGHPQRLPPLPGHHRKGKETTLFFFRPSNSRASAKNDRIRPEPVWPGVWESRLQAVSAGSSEAGLWGQCGAGSQQPPPSAQKRSSQLLFCLCSLFPYVCIN